MTLNNCVRRTFSRRSHWYSRIWTISLLRAGRTVYSATGSRRETIQKTAKCSRPIIKMTNSIAHLHNIDSMQYAYRRHIRKLPLSEICIRFEVMIGVVFLASAISQLLVVFGKLLRESAWMWNGFPYSMVLLRTSVLFLVFGPRNARCTCAVVETAVPYWFLAKHW